MAAYVYSEVTKQQIRLLYLRPAPSYDDPLECELRICQRYPDKECAKYDAVSYTWGGADMDDLKPLRILPPGDVVAPEDVRNLYIKANLADALRRTCE